MQNGSFYTNAQTDKIKVRFQVNLFLFISDSDVESPEETARSLGLERLEITCSSNCKLGMKVGTGQNDIQRTKPDGHCLLGAFFLRT